MGELHCLTMMRVRKPRGVESRIWYFLPRKDSTVRNTRYCRKYALDLASHDNPLWRDNHGKRLSASDWDQPIALPRGIISREWNAREGQGGEGKSRAISREATPGGKDSNYVEVQRLDF